MEKYSCWEDAIFSTTGTSYFIYNLYDENTNLLYTGKAYPMPNSGLIEINISQIVRNYLNSELPDVAFSGATFNVGQVTLPNAVLGFTLTDGKGNVLEEYKFLNCWDYETRFSEIDNSTMNYTLNRPINDHVPYGMYAFNSILTKTNQDKATIYSTSGNSCGYGALYYSNAVGGWDSFLIEGRVKKKDSYEKYQIENGFRADTLQYGNRTINNTISESWELQTQYLSDIESKALVCHLFGSSNIYFHDFSNDRIYPVVITDTSTEVKTWRNQGKKHYSYTINIKNSQNKQRI